MNNEKGIVIIGAGHPIYGQMAANLAASIKRHEDIPVIIYTTPGSMTEHLKNQLIDKCGVEILPLPQETYLVSDDPTGRPNYYRAKTWADKLSPFQKTLFLDADTIWLTAIKPSTVFEQLDGHEFTMSNEGYIDIKSRQWHSTNFYVIWAELEDILQVYGKKMGDRLYIHRSECFYFKKTKTTRAFFQTARSIYDNPKMHIQKAGGKQPDEFAFNVASAITKLYPHQDKYAMAYWAFRNRQVTGSWMNKYQVQYKFPLLSIGGRGMGTMKKYYLEMSEAHFKHFGLRGYEAVPDKADVLPERRKQ